MTGSVASRPIGSGSAGEVWWTFLRLGVTSFGGPVAHLGYFRDTFVERRRWLTDRAYADLVALCQFLPGPASSQVGMGIGLARAGVGGMFAAWAAFTLPSALLLVAFALGASALNDIVGTGWISGLKAAVVGVVAHAVIGMARSLTPDLRRVLIAVAALAVALVVPGALGQVAVIVAAGLLGVLFLRGLEKELGSGGGLVVRVSRRVGTVCLALFALLLVTLPVLATVTGDDAVVLADIFYRAGALVFGGGHVVLPLLEADMVGGGLIGRDAFLAGYGAAQAVPGPLFTFAAYLGAVSSAALPVPAAASLALVAIFLPSALLVVGALAFWERLRQVPLVRPALLGVNAGVVGLLAAALWDPVITQGVTSTLTAAIAVLAFAALQWVRVPSWAVVLGAAVLGGFVL